jgi:tetratricopeptide (TPR) repeat protein
MDKTIKKKIRLVLIAFCILIIPIGYLAAISYAIKIHDNALELAQIKYPDDPDVTQKSIIEIDKAIKIYPWNYLFYMNKAQLQLKLKDYKEALISARKGTEKNNQYAEGLEFQGLIYEYLGQPDSAKILYSKAIDKYKIRLNKNPDNQFTNRGIALLYAIIGDMNNSKAYLTDIHETTEYYEKQLIERYDFYIENYQYGGLRDFLSNESIEMINDSIKDEYKLDSLIHSLRIYYNGHTTITRLNQEKESIYKFRNIFKDKAESIGFRQIEK